MNTIRAKRKMKMKSSGLRKIHAGAWKNKYLIATINPEYMEDVVDVLDNLKVDWIAWGDLDDTVSFTTGTIENMKKARSKLRKLSLIE